MYATETSQPIGVKRPCVCVCVTGASIPGRSFNHSFSFGQGTVKDNDAHHKYGICSLEYRLDAGATKYLLGTESGDVLLLVDRKAKKDAGSTISVKQVFGGGESGSHFGPVYSVKRNPLNTKYFLTVGDWSSKLWCEDLKVPIVLNRCEPSYITAANWSTTRPGVFFTTKMDGVLDIWDIFYKQNEPVLPLKVGEVGLTSVCAHPKGKMLGVGAVDGSVTIMDLSDNLYMGPPAEKAAITNVRPLPA